MKRRLTRPLNNRMIGDVCSGIANWFDTDPTIIRILYVLLSIGSAGFPGLLIYLILYIIIPEEDFTFNI